MSLSANDLLSYFKDYSYFATVTLIFIFMYWAIRLKVSRQKKKKITGLKKRNISDPVETDSPVDNQIKVLKDLGEKGLETRFLFIEKTLPVVLFLLWLVTVNIPYIGKLPAAYVSIVAAVVSVMAGFALRPFLENLFSGVVVSFFKSIQVGDTVMVDEHYGLIEEIGLTHSTVKIWDWNRLVIPNSKLLQKEIQNLTKNDTYIWAHVEFYVAPDTDLDLVSEISIKAAKESVFFKGTEDPSFWIMSLDKDATRCWVAAWADTPGEAWELRADIRKRISKEFSLKGIRSHSQFYVRREERPAY
jgi:small-conductance mechanosensitive channel